jgi:hypothetical protein
VGIDYFLFSFDSLQWTVVDAFYLPNHDAIRLSKAATRNVEFTDAAIAVRAAHFIQYFPLCMIAELASIRASSNRFSARVRVGQGGTALMIA